MAIVLDNASITIDGVDLSDYANHVEINSEKDLHEVTTFGDSSKKYVLGLGDGTMTFQFFPEYGAGGVDDTLWDIHDAGEAVVIVVKADAGAVSASNPSYTMTGVLPSYSPLNGDVGQPSTTEATFQNAAQTGIVRSAT